MKKKAIITPLGQWAHPGKRTIVPTADGRITMKGVSYPVYGQDETGFGQMMYPGQDYQFPGQMVDEHPMMQLGGLSTGPILPMANPIFSKVSNWLSGLFDEKPKPRKRTLYETQSENYNQRYDDVVSKLNRNDAKNYDSSQSFINLSAGRFKGAKVAPGMINDIVAAAKANNVDPWVMLSLVGRESTFGSGVAQNKDRANNKRSLVSGWDVAEDYMPYEFDRYLADKKVPGIRVTKDNHGYYYNTSNIDSVENYLQKHPELINNYTKKLESTPDLGDMDSFNLAAKRIKKTGIAKYNPGDSKYSYMVNQDMQLLKRDPELRAYMKSLGYQMGGSYPMMQHGGSWNKFYIPKAQVGLTAKDRNNIIGYIQKLSKNKSSVQNSEAIPVSNSRDLSKQDMQRIASMSKLMVPTNTREALDAERKEKYGSQWEAEKIEDKRKKQERKTAAITRSKVLAGDDDASFTFPDGTTKKWKDMDWREQSYISGKNLGSLNNDNWTDYINPFAMIGSMAEGMGTAPYEAKKTESITPYLFGVGVPLLTGGLGSLGAKNVGQFVENIVSPIPANLSSVGRYLTEKTPLRHAYKLNRSALTDDMLFNKEGVVNRQIFGDDAYNNFLKYGPTTRPNISQSDQLMELVRAPKSDIRSVATDEVFQVANTMEDGAFKYPYFQEGNLWYTGQQRSNLAKELGKERIITTPKSDLWFAPAGEGSVMEGDNISQGLIDSYSKGRRVLMPGASEYAKPSKYSVFEPHWWKGYKQIQKDGGQIYPMMQRGGGLSTMDSVRHQAGKILKYEQLRGGPGGSPLPFYSDPSYMDMLMNKVYPEVKKIMPGATAMEASEAMDFIFNAGWDKATNKITKDPRAYALQEYYRQYDPSKLDADGKWSGRKNPAYSFDKEYASTIGKLSENQRRVLMNKGRDWYYRNTAPKGSTWDLKTQGPHPDYENTWYGRIWNTNDFLPFNPNNPNFIPKKQMGGGPIVDPRGQSTTGYSNLFPNNNDFLRRLEVFDYVKQQHNQGLDFHTKWLNSPMYNSMINASDPVNAKQITDQRKKRLSGARFKYVDAPYNKAGASTDILGNIEIYPAGIGQKGVGVHEMSHVTDTGPGQNLIPAKDRIDITRYSLASENMPKYEAYKDYFNYVTKPSETRARLNEIRQGASENKLYDPFTQKVSPAIYNKLKNFKFNSNPGNDPLQQLRSAFSDDQILQMLNSVSKNNTEQDMMYAKQGGQHGGLDRWFAEKWVDVKTGKACGRQEGEKRKGYPACRPSRRVNEDTPKTASELSSSEREKFKRSKTSSERINYQHRRKEDGGEINESDMANKPNNPALWSRAKSMAKQKFDVYPSAYANGWAAKWYKSKGGTWRKAEYGMEIPMMEEGGKPEWLLEAQLKAQGYSGPALQQKMSTMAQGGEPQNAGFQALPDYVQAKILSNMGYGGMTYPFMQQGGEPDGEMALGQITAAMDKLAKLRQFIQPDSNLEPWVSSKLTMLDHYTDAVSDYMMYNPEAQEMMMMQQPEGLPMPEMKNGGGIPERYKNMGFTKVGVKKNSTRPGKKWMVLAKKGDQYKVVHGGYDGMKDFSQHGSEKRKENFWNRMGGKNSSKATDPFSPLYWHKRFGTWEEGGEIPEMKGGGSTFSGNAWYKMGGDIPCYECGGNIYQGGGQPETIADKSVGKFCGIQKGINKELAAANAAANRDAAMWAKQAERNEKILAKEEAAKLAGELNFDYDWMGSPVEKPERKAAMAAYKQFFQDNPNTFVADDTSGYNPEQKYIIASKLKQKISTPLFGKNFQQQYGVDPRTLDLQRLQSQMAPRMGGWEGMRNYLFNKKKYGGPAVGTEMDVTPEQLEALRQQGYEFEII